MQIFSLLFIFSRLKDHVFLHLWFFSRKSHFILQTKGEILLASFFTSGEKPFFGDCLKKVEKRLDRTNWFVVQTSWSR